MCFESCTNHRPQCTSGASVASYHLEQLSLIWNNHRKHCRRPRGGPRRGDSRHRTKHDATRLPPAGPPEVRAEICAEIYAAGKVIDFALVAVCGLNNIMFTPDRAAESPC
jgi:hypothetical protein